MRADAAVAVRLEGVSKRYLLFSRRRQRLGALFGLTRGLPVKEALRSVSLEARAGEAVGIIGENGSGKSTLLRLVAGICQADDGKVWVRRPVAALLELGLGFHPDFTGRENALLYGSLLGLGPGEIARALPAILEFADLGEFADQPLRTYSSGMCARLAFAVATQVNPEVLVVDEALAVGDEAFQRKCIARMQAFKEQGKAVLFCSHALYQVVGFCDRALWLHEGEVRAFGSAPEVVQAYQTFLQMRHASSPGFRPLAVTAGPRINNVTLSPDQPLEPGQSLTVKVTARLTRPDWPVHLAVELRDPTGLTVAVFATLWDGLPPLRGEGEKTVVLVLPEVPFCRGPLDLFVHLTDEKGLRVLDTYEARGAIAVVSRRWQPGFVEPRHCWEVEA